METPSKAITAQAKNMGVNPPSAIPLTVVKISKSNPESRIDSKEIVVARTLDGIKSLDS